MNETDQFHDVNDDFQKNWYVNSDGVTELGTKEYIEVFAGMGSGAMSLICLYALIRENILDIRQSSARSLPLQMTIMSVFMGTSSLMHFLGPIPAPAKIPMWGTSGTTQTCSFQGFMITFGVVAGMVSHGSLIWLMKLMVCQNLKDHQLVPYVKYTNGFAFTLGFVLALIPTVLGLINYNGSNCWISPFPRHCIDDENLECIRGALAPSFRAVYFVFPYYFILFAEVYCFYRIYQTVRMNENRTSRYAKMWTAISGYVNGTITHQPTSDENEAGNIHLKNARPKINSQSMRARTSSVNREREEERINRAKSQAVAHQAALLLLGWSFSLLYVTFEVALQMSTGKRWYAVDIIGDIIIHFLPLVTFVAFATSRGKMKTPLAQILRKLLICCVGSCNLLAIICNIRPLSQSWRESSTKTPGTSETIPHPECSINTASATPNANRLSTTSNTTMLDGSMIPNERFHCETFCTANSSSGPPTPSHAELDL